MTTYINIKLYTDALAFIGIYTKQRRFVHIMQYDTQALYTLSMTILYYY